MALMLVRMQMAKKKISAGDSRKEEMRLCQAAQHLAGKREI
jgi:hypothetical protein